MSDLELFIASHASSLKDIAQKFKNLADEIDEGKPLGIYLSLKTAFELAKKSKRAKRRVRHKFKKYKSTIINYDRFTNSR